MLFEPPTLHWSTLINIIIQNYFRDAITICIIWHKDFEFEPQIAANGNFSAFFVIRREYLGSSFQEEAQIEIPQFDNLAQQLTTAIEKRHCESFIAFQEDIPEFAFAFGNASKRASWTTQRNRFLFVYSKDLQEEKEAAAYFEEELFKDQPGILIIEAAAYVATEFELKTTKFVGSVLDNPEALYTLDTFDALAQSFACNCDLYPDKILDLQGRELIVGAFDYRPFTVVDFHIQPQIVDLAANNPSGSVHLDGTEVRLALMFCEKYNCTVQADSTEHGEWGQIYSNATGYGLFGLLLENKVHVIAGAFYEWEVDFVTRTTFLGRSGITCMVPAPKRLISWNLPLRPFRLTLWLGVGACLCVETIALLVARHMEQTAAAGATTSDDSAVNAAAKHSWLNSFRFGYHTTLKLFISQGSDYVVRSLSVRTVLVSCYMIDIIVTSIYGGGLASILTLPTLGEAADSFERLYKFDIPWAATSMDWVYAMQRDQDNPIIGRLLQNYRVLSFDEMREKAKTENMGFIVERMTFGHFGNSEYLTAAAFEHLKLMLDDVYFQFTVSFVPRLWPFLTKYNNLIYAWHSSGFSKFWEWRVSADYLNEIQQEQIQSSMITNLDVGPVQLGMENFAGLILVWLVGTALSVLGFGLELFVWHKKNQKKQRKSFDDDAEANKLK